MDIGEGWLSRNTASKNAESLISEIRTRVNARKASPSIRTTSIDIANALTVGISSHAAIARDWFFSSVGIINEIDGSKETWYLTQALVGAQFADTNIVSWTSWLGDVYTRAKNAIIDGRSPERMNYGPPHKQATRDLGPVCDYVIRNGSLARLEFFTHQDSQPATSAVEAKRIKTEKGEVDDFGTGVFDGAVEANRIKTENGEEDGRFGLRSIIRTIDLQQNDQIRGPLFGTFILMGGPGVGKTTVALHRIPYLIDAYNDPAQQIPKNTIAVTEANTLVVVLKKHLVPYLRQCLDHLGLNSLSGENVVLMDDWVASQLRNYIALGKDGYRITGANDDVERAKLLISEDMLRAFLKSSPQLGPFFKSELSVVCDELHSLCLELKEKVDIPKELLGRSKLTYRNIDGRIITLLDRFEKTKQGTVMLRQAIQRLKLLQKAASGGRLVSILRALFASKIAQTEIHRSLGEDALAAFNDAITEQVASRAISNVDRYLLLWMVELSQTKTDKKLFKKGLPQLKRYGHVMIDEAQYYEPILLRLLTKITQTTMTIVGDLEQRITAKGGLVSWKAAGIEVPPENINRLEVNYRWSKPVFEFLELFKSVADIKEPLKRPRQWFSQGGVPPEVLSFDSKQSERAGIVTRISALRNLPNSTLWTIVVVVPDPYQSDVTNFFLPELATYDIAARWATGEDVKDSIHQVIFTNFDSVVGLEFNAVFVIGLNEILGGPRRVRRESIPSIWVAITRARQALTISRVKHDAVFDDPVFAPYRPQ